MTSRKEQIHSFTFSAICRWKQYHVSRPALGYKTSFPCLLPSSKHEMMTYTIAERGQTPPSKTVHHIVHKLSHSCQLSTRSKAAVAWMTMTVTIPAGLNVSRWYPVAWCSTPKVSDLLPVHEMEAIAELKVHAAMFVRVFVRPYCYLRKALASNILFKLPPPPVSISSAKRKYHVRQR